MSPENARVIIVHDDRDYLKILTLWLEGSGHQVIKTAHNLEDGKKLIEEIKNNGPTINVALLDGNLSHASSGGNDGRTLAKQVRDQLPGVKVLSISGDPQKWSDKPELTSADGSQKITKVITEI